MKRIFLADFRFRFFKPKSYCFMPQSLKCFFFPAVRYKDDEKPLGNARRSQSLAPKRVGEKALKHVNSFTIVCNNADNSR